jgi:Transposase DDE domain group 1
MTSIRQAANGTQLAKTQVERLRLLLIKGAAKVTVSTRRILVELAASCPFAKELHQIVRQLSKSQSLKFE